MSDANAKPDSLNDQVKDAIAQLSASLQGMSQDFTGAVAYQTVAHTVALALHNTVVQQQHNQILRNALTTAAANALLEGKTEEAAAVLKLADEKLGTQQNLSEEIQKLGAILKSIGQESKAPAKKAPAPRRSKKKTKS